MSEINYWDQIEEAFDAVEIHETYDVFKQTAGKYPDWKIDILAVHWTMSEVLNGGLEQYFSNSTGILAPEAVLGFTRIGKPELAAALQKAMALLGETYPREREERVERLAALTDGEKATKNEGFSLVPKWVAMKVRMKPGQSPFDEMDEVLVGAAEDVWRALDEYARMKAGQPNQGASRPASQGDVRTRVRMRFVRSTACVGPGRSFGSWPLVEKSGWDF